MRHAIAVKDLRKTYAGPGTKFAVAKLLSRRDDGKISAGAGGTEALKGVSLTIAEGDFFALLGPNGAGKTTLIGILTSLVNKTSGEAAIHGHDIEREPSKAKTYIGLVPQEFNFDFFDTVFNIVVNQAGYYGIPRAEAIARLEPLLKDLGLWEKRDEKAQGLSGGMKRRLMIARALIHQPKLLILDEPTAGVDVELRRHMWDFLRKLNASGTTIVLTTHYLEEAEQLARNVAIINKGEVVVSEPMQGFLERHGNKKLEDIYLEVIGEAQSHN
jgi:ABC-2 type transport system ATP-binding protein